MGEIYKQNFQIVYRYLYSLCNNADLAEDLMQETFLKACEGIERFNGNCKMSTWLCQIAKHLLYQYYEKNNKIKIQQIDDEFFAQSFAQNLVQEDTESIVINKIELSAVWA